MTSELVASFCGPDLMSADGDGKSNLGYYYRNMGTCLEHILISECVTELELEWIKEYATGGLIAL